LPNLCASPRRAMYQTRSNGDAAPAPVYIGALSPEYAMPGADDVACAPTYFWLCYSSDLYQVYQLGIMYDLSVAEFKTGLKKTENTEPIIIYNLSCNRDNNNQ